MEQALARVKYYVENGTRVHSIFAVNPEKNFSVPKDPVLYEAFKTADLLIPDGIGVVAAARVLYEIELSRVPGCELMQNICRLSAERGYRVFIYGAQEEINKKAVEVLPGIFPGLQIVGRANGYTRDEEMETLVQRINEAKAQVLFLALGSPKQEKWLAKYKDRLDTVRVCQGIGGTLDVITGKVKRAPDLWCRFGVEWLYRLLAEPKRIRRQWVLPVFAAEVVMARLKRTVSSKH